MVAAAVLDQLLAPVSAPIVVPPVPVRVPYIDFKAQYAEEREEIHSIVDRVFSKGDFIAGQAVTELETALAARCGVKHAVALASGTDADRKSTRLNSSH